jgi:ribosomal protein L11 methyltransferase
VIRLAVRAARADAPALLAELLVFSPAGLEEVDVDDQTIEYVIYGAPGELPSAAEFEASSDVDLLAVQTSEVADDWSERWRAFHQPIVVSDRLYVRPPWLPPLRQSDSGEPLIDLVIEPGQAFGTGSHATTRLCLELLVARERSGTAHGSLLDIGCGSGVLAIAAAKLGWSPVTAVDHEVESIAAARANAEANAVAIAVRRADLHTDALDPAQTIVANLLRPLLLELSERLEHQPRCLIASGLLADQGDELAAELAARHGLQERRRERDGDWLALAFEPAA